MKSRFLILCAKQYYNSNFNWLNNSIIPILIFYTVNFMSSFYVLALVFVSEGCSVNDSPLSKLLLGKSPTN